VVVSPREALQGLLSPAAIGRIGRAMSIAACATLGDRAVVLLKVRQESRVEMLDARRNAAGR
jgi:hypothetical protein